MIEPSVRFNNENIQLKLTFEVIKKSCPLFIVTNVNNEPNVRRRSTAGQHPIEFCVL